MIAEYSGYFVYLCCMYYIYLTIPVILEMCSTCLWHINQQSIVYPYIKCVIYISFLHYKFDKWDVSFVNLLVAVRSREYVMFICHVFYLAILAIISNEHTDIFYSSVITIISQNFMVYSSIHYKVPIRHLYLNDVFLFII